MYCRNCAIHFRIWKYKSYPISSQNKGLLILWYNKVNFLTVYFLTVSGAYSKHFSFDMEKIWISLLHILTSMSLLLMHKLHTC
jgi:hypothetical protein